MPRKVIVEKLENNMSSNIWSNVIHQEVKFISNYKILDVTHRMLKIQVRNNLRIHWNIPKIIQLYDSSPLHTRVFQNYIRCTPSPLAIRESITNLPTCLPPNLTTRGKL